MVIASCMSSIAWGRLNTFCLLICNVFLGGNLALFVGSDLAGPTALTASCGRRLFPRCGCARTQSAT